MHAPAQRDARLWLFVVLALLGLGACSTVLGVDFDAPRLATVVTGAEGGVPGACVPRSCSDQGFVCGTQNDGCGNAMECGACGGPCIDGKCACTPKTCPELGATCGVVDNGCGATLDCGTCAGATDACVQNKCECKPKNCDAVAANCGTIPDGCGNTYVCGTCDPNSVKPNCGGEGPNKCGANTCVPLTCAGRCGDVSDGCGTLLKCGGCAAPQSCGGGGVASVCGCTPTTCAQQGKNCGTISNGCGGTLDCGACGSPNSCGGGGVPSVCGCTPTATACPAGQNCGTIPNGCGANISCGLACAPPNSCGGGGLLNVCGCKPLTCDSFICGSHANGCGGTLFCGTCSTCFTGQTKITMADGSVKAIERIVAGDWIRTTNPETGVIDRAQVVELKSHAKELSRAGIVVIDGALHATRNHPIWVNGHTATMEDVREGDELVVLDGTTRQQRRRVARVTLEPGGVVTYDLVLAGSAQHYFADGVVVQRKPIEP